MMRPMRDQITPTMVFQGLPWLHADATRGLNASYRFGTTGAARNLDGQDRRWHVRDRRRAGAIDWRFDRHETWIGHDDR